MLQARDRPFRGVHVAVQDRLQHLMGIRGMRRSGRGLDLVLQEVPFNAAPRGVRRGEVVRRSDGGEVESCELEPRREIREPAYCENDRRHIQVHKQVRRLIEDKGILVA